MKNNTYIKLSLGSFVFIPSKPQRGYYESFLSGQDKLVMTGWETLSSLLSGGSSLQNELILYDSSRDLYFKSINNYATNVVTTHNLSFVDFEWTLSSHVDNVSITETIIYRKFPLLLGGIVNKNIILLSGASTSCYPQGIGRIAPQQVGECKVRISNSHFYTKMSTTPNNQTRTVTSVNGHREVRRERNQRLAQEAAEKNTFQTLQVGPLNLNFKRFSEDYGQKFDTSRKYHHIGGAMQVWRTQREWTNARSGKVVHYAKGHFSYLRKSTCNPQAEGTPGVRLPSNPLPPFRQAQPRIVPEKEEVDRQLEYFRFFTDDVLDSKINKFCYDTFLTDEQNKELVNDFRVKLGIDAPDRKKYVAQGASDEEDDDVQFGSTHDGEPTEEVVDPIVAANIVRDNEIDRQIVLAKSSHEAYALADWVTSRDESFYRQAEVRWRFMRQTDPPPVWKQFWESACMAKAQLARCAEYNKPTMADLDKIEPVVESKPQCQKPSAGLTNHWGEPITTEDSTSSSSEDEGMWGMVKSTVGLPTALHSAARNMNKLSVAARKALPSFTKSAKRVEQSAAEASSIMDKVKRTFSNIQYLNIPGYVNLVGSAFNLFYDAYNYKMYSLPILIMKTTTSLSALLRPLIEIYKFYEADLDIQHQRYLAQGYTPHKHENDTLLRSLLGCETLFNLGKTMNAFDQVRRGFTTVREFASWICESLPTGLSELISKMLPSKVQFDKRYKNYAEKAMRLVMLMEAQNKIPQGQLDFVVQETKEITVLLSTPNNKDAYMAFKHMRPMVLKMVAYADQYSKLSTPRKCPYSLVIHGESRIGKTVLMNRVAHELAQITGHMNQDILYIRQAGTDHWDGFTDTYFACGFDDWLQNTDYEDVSEFFSLVTKQHYIVPMASLDDPLVGKKGTLNLCKLVIAATNLENKQAVATKINCPKALFARIATRVKATKVSDEYDEVNFSHMRFQFYETRRTNYVSNRQPDVDDEYMGPTLNYEEFMLSVAQRMAKHEQTQNRIDTAQPSLELRDKMKRAYQAQGMFGAAAGIGTTILSLSYWYVNKDVPHFEEDASCALLLGVCVGLCVIGSFVYSFMTKPSIVDADISEKLEIVRFILSGKTQHILAQSIVLSSPNPDALLMKTLRDLYAVKAEHPDKAILTSELQFFAESKAMDQRSQRRPMMRGESRALDQKSKHRPHMTAEAGITDHSKFNTGFYEAQRKLQEQPVYVSQGCSDPQTIKSMEILTERILPVSLQKTDYTQNYSGVTSVKNFVNAIPVDAHTVLMPKHFFLNEKGLFIQNTDAIQYRMVFRNAEKLHPVVYSRDRVKPMFTSGGQDSLDAVLVDLSATTIPALRSCAGQFIRDHDLPLVKKNCEAAMIGYTLRAGQPVLMQHTFNVQPLTQTEYYGQGDAVFSVSRGYLYEAPTEQGECGAPVMIFNKSIPNKIIGIHTFGMATECEGGCITMTADMIERNLQRKPIVYVEPQVTFHATERFDQLKRTTQNLTVELLGEVDIPVYVSRSTDFRKTILFEELEELVDIPSEKRINEGEDPLIVNALLYGGDLYTPDEKHRESVLEYLSHKFKDWDSVSVLTAHQAVNARGRMDRLNLHTSAGYPYVLKGQSKRTFLQVDDKTGNVTFKDPAFECYVQDYVTSWETMYHDVVWIISLKDELKKVGKLCRAFEFPPLEYTIACRAYFGSWIDMMHSTVGEHFCCVGINPESLQWSELIYKLLGMSPYGLDADVPNFDKALLPVYFMWATESVNRWYRKNDKHWQKEHDMARYNLIVNLCKSLFLAGWLLLRRCKGMPSGHVLTALFNSMLNMIMHLIWFLNCAPLSVRDTAFYDDCVKTFVYGDDSLDAVRQDLLQYLNRETMKKVYSEQCTCSITAGVKDGKMSPYDPVLSLTFLKRGIRCDGLLYKPVLAERSLFGMLAWTRLNKCFTQDEQLCCNMRTFSSFAYFYGPEYYNRITAYFGNLYPSYQFPCYQYYDTLFRYGKFDMMFNLN
jgi:hypothetical protein